jgi:hypothetical protein
MQPIPVHKEIVCQLVTKSAHPRDTKFDYCFQNTLQLEENDEEIFVASAPVFEQYVSQYVSQCVSRYVSPYVSQCVSQCFSQCVSRCLSQFVSQYVSQYVSRYVSSNLIRMSVYIKNSGLRGAVQRMGEIRGA